MLFGSSRLPGIARGTGKHLRKTKDSVGTFKEEFEGGMREIDPVSPIKETMKNAEAGKATPSAPKDAKTAGAQALTGVSGAPPPSTAAALRAASTAIAVRVSIVAEPRCGMSTAFSSSSRPGCTSGSCSKTSSPAPAITPARERLGERGLVDHGAARRVDEVGVAAHLAQALGRDQVRRLGRQRAVQRDDVARREQLVEAEEARAELGLDRLVGAPPAAVGDLHAERARAARRRGADLAEADDAERLALQARAEHVVHVPAPADLAADHALALAEAPRDHQDQRHRDVGRRVGEHAGRVRDDARRARRRPATSMLL